MFWFFAFYVVIKVFAIKVHKLLSITAYTLVILLLIPISMFASLPEHIFKVKRDFNVEILDSGYKFIWQNQERPVLKDYKLEKNE